MAPAATIACWLLGLSVARLVSAQAAASCAALLPLRSSRTRAGAAPATPFASLIGRRQMPGCVSSWRLNTGSSRTTTSGHKPPCSGNRIAQSSPTSMRAGTGGASS